MAGSKFHTYGTAQDIDLENALRRAHIERSAVIRTGLRRLWTAGPFGHAAAKSIR